MDSDEFPDFRKACEDGTLQHVPDLLFHEKYRKICNVGFYLACQHGHLEVVKLFLDVNDKQVLALQASLLIAAQNHHTEIVKEIATRFEAEVNLNEIFIIISSYGETFSDVLLELIKTEFLDVKAVFMSAIKMNNQLLISELMELGPAHIDEALIEAARFGWHESVIALASLADAMTIKEGFIVAASANRKSVVEILIPSIADVDVETYSKALQGALKIRGFDVVQLLLKHAKDFTDPDLSNIFVAACASGDIAIIEIILNFIPDHHIIDWRAALNTTAAYNHIHIVEFIHYTASCNGYVTNWAKPLLEACINDAYEMVCYLFDNHLVDPYIVLRWGPTALRFACRYASMQTIMRILTYLEEFDLDVNLQEAFIGACQSDQEHVVDMLLKRKTKLYILDIEPGFEQACLMGCLRIVKKLLPSIKNRYLLEAILSKLTGKGYVNIETLLIGQISRLSTLNNIPHPAILSITIFGTERSCPP